MKVLINLSENPSLKRSRNLGLAIKPFLEGLVTANLLYLATHHVPLLYKSGVRYQEEPPGTVEEFAGIPVIIARGWGDCMPAGTLLLTETHDLVPIEDIEPGTRIWGKDRWTTVEAVTSRGVKNVWDLHLNNGSRLQLTPEHRVYARTCSRHPRSWADRSHSPCDCPEAREERVTVGELESGQILTQPDRVDFSAGISDPAKFQDELDLAHLQGLYVSDGWVDNRFNRFSISGKDGHPKEAQKLRVKKICERLGLNYRWHERYITVNDAELAVKFAACGHRAPEKRALTIDLDEARAAALLSGIMADSGKNTNGGSTFTTTSRLLCAQTRVLHRMFGRACGYAYLPIHGGLGENPAHRLFVRDSQAKGPKRLRVNEIVKDASEVPCWDLQTEDHYVYLPEHDVTISNCDDLAPWRCAELRRSGEKAKIRLTWRQPVPGGRKEFHVQVRREDGRIEDPSLILGMNQ